MRVLLMTKEIRDKLIDNFNANAARVEAGDRTTDFEPVMKAFTPDAGATWLFTELDPETNELFGLCDLGMGYPEIGYVSLDELQDVRGKLGLPVERDRFFKATKTLSEYADEARGNGRVAA